MNGNWHTYQRQLAVMLGNIPLGAIVLAASVLTPIRALSDTAAPEAPSSVSVAKATPPVGDPIATGTLTAIKVTGATARLSCDDAAARFLTSSHLFARGARTADVARARLVFEHLRYQEGPGALLELERTEQDFAADRAEVRGVRQDIAQEEHELTTARCEEQEADRTSLSLQPDTTAEARIELPRPETPMGADLTSGKRAWGDGSMAADVWAVGHPGAAR